MNPDPLSSSSPPNAIHWPGVRFRQNADGVVADAEAGFHELVGHVSPSCELNFWEVVHPGDRTWLRERITGMNAAAAELISRLRIRRLDTGRIVHLLERRRRAENGAGFPPAYECEWLDVTREVLAEQRLAASAWNQTFNHLLRGMGHDMANFVAGVQVLLEACHARLSPEHPLREMATQVRQRAQHAGEVLRRVGELNRRQPGARGWADVRTVVVEIKEIAACLFPKRLRVETELPTEPIEAEFDIIALQRALLALVVEAMQSTRRALTLQLRVRRCERPEEAGTLGVPEGNQPAICMWIQRRPSVQVASRSAQVGPERQTTSRPSATTSAGLLAARMFALAHAGGVAELPPSDMEPGVGLWWPVLAPQAADRNATPCVLIGGTDSALTQDLVAEFRRAGFPAALASGADELIVMLGSPEYEFGGVILQLEASPQVDEAIVRALNSPGYRGLKVALVNETGIFDDVSPELWNRADLRVSRAGVIRAFTAAIR